MKKALAMLVSAVALLTASPVWADSTIVGSDNKFVYIQADGKGRSKIDALNAAWIEAIHTGVGQFMTGSTQNMNKYLQEKIAAYSQGKVKRFEILSESQQDGLWTIAIKAALEKDMLIQSEKSTEKSEKNTKKQRLNSDKLASLMTSVAQNQDASDIIDSFVLYESPEQYLDYSFDVQNINDQIYALHLIKVNLKKFTDDIVKNTSELFNALAEANYEAPMSNDAEKSLYERINSWAIPEDCSSRIERNRSDEETKLISYGYSRIFELLQFKPRFGLPYKYTNLSRVELCDKSIAVCDLKKYHVYIFKNKNLVNKIMKNIFNRRYKISFFTDIECGPENLRFKSSSEKVSFFAVYGDYWWNNVICPVINKSDMYLVFLIAHKLDIPQNKISQITNINGRYELKETE